MKSIVGKKGIGRFGDHNISWFIICRNSENNWLVGMCMADIGCCKPKKGVFLCLGKRDYQYSNDYAKILLKGHGMRVDLQNVKIVVFIGQLADEFWF
jgi:hypothetical protein